MALSSEWMDDWVGEWLGGGAGVEGSVHQEVIGPAVIGRYNTFHFNMTQRNAMQRKTGLTFGKARQCLRH